MSSALERLGRFAARRPWIVIGSWVAIGFLVITSAAAFGREVARIQEAVAALPKVLGTTDPTAALRAGRQAAVESGVVSPDGEVALIRIQYPERQHLEPGDLENLKALLADLGESSTLQIEAGGDLHFASEAAGSPCTGVKSLPSTVNDVPRIGPCPDGHPAPRPLGYARCTPGVAPHCS